MLADPDLAKKFNNFSLEHDLLILLYRYEVPGAAQDKSAASATTTGNERMANNILRGLIEDTGIVTNNTNGAQKRPREAEEDASVKR